MFNMLQFTLYGKVKLKYAFQNCSHYLKRSDNGALSEWSEAT